MSDSSSAKLQITQLRSAIGSQDAHRRTLRALGLRRRHQTVTQPDRPEIRGMLSKVAHLVEVTYSGEEEALVLEPGQEPKGEGNPPAGQSVADDEAAEIAEGIDEALSVEGSVDNVADLVQNEPALGAEDQLTGSSSRASSAGDEEQAEADQGGEQPAEEEEGS